MDKITFTVEKNATLEQFEWIFPDEPLSFGDFMNFMAFIECYESPSDEVVGMFSQFPKINLDLANFEVLVLVSPGHVLGIDAGDYSFVSGSIDELLGKYPTLRTDVSKKLTDYEVAPELAEELTKIQTELPTDEVIAKLAVISEIQRRADLEILAGEDCEL
jgi:hypothetical protein